MPPSFGTPADYDFAIKYGAADICAVAPNNIPLTTYGVKPRSLHGFAMKQEEAELAEADGAVDLSDGKAAAVTMGFDGDTYGQDQDDTFSGLASLANLLIVSTPYRYLRAGMYDGSTKIYCRRYGKPLGGDADYYPKTRFGSAKFQMDFRAHDPFWYFDTANVVNVSVNATPKVQATTDTGISRSKRLLIKIAKNASACVVNNVSVKNNANQTIAISGSLATNGDYWLIDMKNGKVWKSVSGVLSSDKTHVTGMFWGIKNGSDSITITNAGSFGGGTFDVTLTWLERRM
jgi:hypothetical protein